MKSLLPTPTLRMIRSLFANSLLPANDMTDDEASLYKYHTIIFFKGFTEAERRTMTEMKAVGRRVILDVSGNLLPPAPWKLIVYLKESAISFIDQLLCDSGIGQRWRHKIHFSSIL